MVRLEKNLENKLERLPRDERGPRRELISGLAQFVVGRERLRQMRERGEILGVVRGERRPTLYPRWQFGADGEILEGLPDVISAAKEVGMGPEELHFFMTEPDERLGGERPVEPLRRGEAEKVADLLLSAGLGPF